MREKLKIRTLGAGEIECRVGSIRENGISLLLYKDARVDQRLLDEIFGPLIRFGKSITFNFENENESKFMGVENFDKILVCHS